MEDYHVLEEFQDVFLDEVPGLTPKMGINFTIDLVPRAAPVSRIPYMIITLELLEMKIQLQELLGKKYIHPSVSPWGVLVLFMKKKDGTLRLCIDYR